MTPFEQLNANKEKFKTKFMIADRARNTHGELSNLPRGANMFDHVEYWKTQNNSFVLVASPYVGYGDKSKEFADLGFSEFKPLYSLDAKTYVRHFYTRKDVEKFASSLIH